MKKILTILLSAAMLAGTSVQAAEERYTVDKIYFSDLMDNTVENPSNGCMVNVELTKNEEEENTIVIASYSTDGKLIGISTMKGSMQTGATTKFSTTFNVPAGKEIGTVKAYVWDSTLSMKPISNTKSYAVSDSVLPPNEPVVDKYIPDIITVKGTVIGTPGSTATAVVEEGYEIEVTEVVLPKDNIYTGEQYREYVDRKNNIATEYGFNFVTGMVNTCFAESEIKLEDYLFMTGHIMLTRNAKDDYIVLGFTPIESNNYIEIDASEYVKQSTLDAYSRFGVSNDSAGGSSSLKFGKESYWMNDRGNSAFTLYVNGQYAYYVMSSDQYANEYLDRLLGNAEGKIRLYRENVGSGYSKVLINCEEVAKITEILTNDEGNTEIHFAPEKRITQSYAIVINPDELEKGYRKVTVIKNGKEIGYDELVAGDRISIRTAFRNEAMWSLSYDNLLITVLEDEVTPSRFEVVNNMSGAEETEEGIPVTGIGSEDVLTQDDILTQGSIFDTTAVESELPEAEEASAEDSGSVED